MTMFSTVSVKCPSCDERLESIISVPEPDFGADKMRDSGVSFIDVIVCNQCHNEIQYSGANSYYGLSMIFEGLDEEDFNYTEPDYEFDEYEIDPDLTVLGIIEDRKITSLFHFSKVENLENIIRKGIIPRKYLKKGSYRSTDNHRWDGFLNASCLTVSFPQCVMFYPKRCDDKSQDWVVLEIDTAILDRKDCAFFETNAASNAVKEEIILNRKTPTAFERMFDDLENKPSRSRLKIPDNYPTDPQAEVLVFGNVEPNLIKELHFETDTVKEQFKKLVLGKECSTTPRLFEKR